jgi:hypothetical protein
MQVKIYTVQNLYSQFLYSTNFIQSQKHPFGVLNNYIFACGPYYLLFYHLPFSISPLGKLSTMVNKKKTQNQP